MSINQPTKLYTITLHIFSNSRFLIKIYAYIYHKDKIWPRKCPLAHKVYTIISFLSPSLFLSPLSGDGVECVFDLGVECMGASGYVVILDSHLITQPKPEEKYSSDLGFFLIAQIKKQVIPYLTRLTLG